MFSCAFDDEPYHVVKTWLYNQNTKCCVEQKAPLGKNSKISSCALKRDENKIY
jgi:hypothetical protein